MILTCRHYREELAGTQITSGDLPFKISFVILLKQLASTPDKLSINADYQYMYRLSGRWIKKICSHPMHKTFLPS
jgi:hypothetical protein